MDKFQGKKNIKFVNRTKCLNSQGATAGMVSSLAAMSYVIFRSQTDIAKGLIRFQTLPLSTEGCTYNFELNNSTLVDDSHENGNSLHNMSFFYYTGKKLISS